MAENKKSFWSALGSSLLSGLSSSLGGLPGALVNVGTSLFGNWLSDKSGQSDLKRQEASSKELSKYNNELNFDTWMKQFDLQNARQDYLNQNKYQMEVNSMRQAGLNAAMMNGAPQIVGASNPSGGNSSGASSGSPSQNMILEGMQLNMQNKLTDSDVAVKKAQADLLAEEKRGKEIDNNNKDNFWNLTLDQMRTNLEESKRTLEDKVSIFRSTLDNLIKEGSLKEKQASNLEESTNKLVQETKGIKIDNKFKSERNREEINQIKATTRKLVAEASIEEVKAELANVGIIVGADFLTQLLAVAQRGSASGILENVISMIKDLLSSVSSSSGGIIDSVIDGVKDKFTHNPSPSGNGGSSSW